MIGHLLVVLAGLALAGLGVAAVAAPGPLSRGYGIPANDGRALVYVRATGVRDALFGLMLLCLVALGTESALPYAVALCVLVALADLSLVKAAAGATARASLLIHAGGAVGLLVVWSFLRAGL